jgi:hypothetical protein
LPDQKPIFPDALIDEMLRPTTPGLEDPDAVRYGIGWRGYEVAGSPAWGHGGGMGGVSTDLTLFTRHNIAIAVLVNAQGQAPVIGRIREAIHKTLVPTAEKLRALAKDGPYHGSWRGTAETYDRKVPVALTIADAVQVRIGNAPAQTVADVSVDREGFLWLNGVEGDLGSADAKRYPYRLQFKLSPGGDALTGSVTAISVGLAGRTGNGLSSFVRLGKD